MTDFISQATLKSLDTCKDLLLHDEMANSVSEKAPLLPPGAVIAVQGPWGRGKTDVLARIAKKSLAKKIPDWMACEAIWINPWQYATPDLLTPLVIELLERIPKPRRSNSKSLRTAAETIIRAGANFGLKAASIIMPSGGLLKEAAGPVDDLLAGLFTALKEEEIEQPEADPVSKMADRFRQLVKEVLASRNAGQNARLVICIDDLDRCLPDRQVAMLEALRFLTSTGAATTFLIALDPALARQAVVAHYGTTAFDPDRYLDKMFHLRVNLPALNKDQLMGLVSGHLEQELPCPCKKYPLKDCLVNLVERFEFTQSLEYSGYQWIKAEYGPSIDELAELFVDALPVRDLRNPRIIDRIFQRLYLVAISGMNAEEVGIHESYDLKTFIMWLGIIERWPDVRAAFQNSDYGHDICWGTLRGLRLAEIRMHYLWRDDLELEPGVYNLDDVERLNSRKSAITGRLPNRDESPELRQMILLLTEDLPHDTNNLYPLPGDQWGNFADLLGKFDNALIEIGL